LQPVTHAEMRNVVGIWADAAMRLENRDLRMMARLVRAQDRLSVASREEEFVEQLFSAAPDVVNA
jgi:hypothetical protein